MMLEDGVVTNLLTGGPAYMCKKILKGDRVVKIEDTRIDSKGQDAKGSHAAKLILGPDVPGSLVNITFQRPSTRAEFDVTLVRACTSELADQRKMFQFFTQIKDLALSLQKDADKSNDGHGKQILSVVDDTIDLWTKMLEAECRWEEKLVKKITTMQTSSSSAVSSMREQLEKLHAIARIACTNMSRIAKNEADLTKALKIEKERASKLEAELLECRAKYQAAYNEQKENASTIAQLRKENAGACLLTVRV